MPPRSVLRSALCAAALVLSAGTAPAQDQADRERNRIRLERAVHAVWLEAEPDHARVREGGLENDAVALSRDVARMLADDPTRYATPVERIGALRDAAARARRMHEREGATQQSRWPISATSTAIALDRCWAGPPAPADDLPSMLVARLRALFARERFADCWDEGFLETPEVRAWRAFHAKPVPVETGPKPVPTEGPTAPELPPPVALAEQLVFVDKAHGWVGPWAGWIEDIKKDNKRQKRTIPSSVQAKSVWIQRNEVTRADYLRFLAGADAGRRRSLLPKDWTIDDAGTVEPPAGPQNVPVTGVTYLQALAYAESFGMRLPTEDEWDRAAAGGEKEPRIFPWGPSAEGKKWANAAASLKGPAPIDAHADDATPDGVLGLAGNVAEMVSTQPDRRDLGAKLPDGDFQIVVRGGNWRSRESECQTSYRWFTEARTGADHVGFRCVMDDAEYRRRFR